VERKHTIVVRYLPTVSIANNEVCVMVVDRTLLRTHIPILEYVEPLIEVGLYWVISSDCDVSDKSIKIQFSVPSTIHYNNRLL
jgi:hypothetical protein